MRFYKNMLQIHLHHLMAAQSAAVPWIYLSDARNLAWQNLKGQTALSKYFTIWHRLTEQAPLDLRLCFGNAARDALHDMCREDIMTVRERITRGNLESVAAKRFGNQPEELERCVASFRAALDRSETLIRTRDYSLIADEALHVYYPNKLVLVLNDDDENNGNGGSGGDEEPCECLDWGFARPPGVIPAPVPEPAGEGGRVPGGIPQPA